MADTKITVTFARQGIEVSINQLDGLSPGALERAWEKVQRAFHLENSRVHQQRLRARQEETTRQKNAREKAEGEARTKAMNEAAAIADKERASAEKSTKAGAEA